VSGGDRLDQGARRRRIGTRDIGRSRGRVLPQKGRRAPHRLGQRPYELRDARPDEAVGLRRARR